MKSLEELITNDKLFSSTFFDNDFIDSNRKMFKINYCKEFNIYI